MDAKLAFYYFIGNQQPPSLQAMTMLQVMQLLKIPFIFKTFLLLKVLSLNEHETVRGT